METLFEGRLADSPYIEMIWRGRTGKNYFAVCPADERWNLLLMKHNQQVRVSVEGPTTKAISKSHPEGVEFLVIKFKLGVFMPYLSLKNLQNGDNTLPNAASQSFWLNGFSWPFPDFENVESFVTRLVREDILYLDPVVNASLQNESPYASFRTVRRRFLQATGLTQGTIRQIERARHAAALLENGVSILDAVDLAGYADQPHLTRSLRRFIGHTPAQILQTPP